MSTDAALIRAVLAHPDQDTPREVYADFLDDHADRLPDPAAARARAELIRVQVGHARLPPLPPVLPIRLAGPITSPEPHVFSAAFGRRNVPPGVAVGDVIDVRVHNPVEGEVLIRGARVEGVNPPDRLGLLDLLDLSAVVLELRHDRDYYPGDRGRAEELRERSTGLFDRLGCGAARAAASGVPAGWAVGDGTGRTTDPRDLRAAAAVVRRGFVEAVIGPAARWLADAGEFLAAHPVRRVWLTTPPTPEQDATVARQAQEYGITVNRLSPLLPRHAEVVARVSEGHTPDEIGAVLGISARTVRRIVDRWRELAGSNSG